MDSSQTKAWMIWCPHPREEMTAPDEHGYAICRLCLGSIPVSLTQYQLQRAFDAIWERGRR